MTDQERTNRADEYATAMLTAMLTAEDSGDPAQLHALLQEASKNVSASMVVTALASHGATLVRLVATREGVPWQEVMQKLGAASELVRGGPQPPTGPGPTGPSAR